MTLGILHVVTAVMFGMIAALWDRSRWAEIGVIAVLVVMAAMHAVAAASAFGV